MLEKLFSSYANSNVLLSDFVTALSPSNPKFGLTLSVVLITFLLGFLVYVYSFILVVREKSAPYPLFLHTFYCAADFMGIWVFACAYKQTGGFWFFLLGCIGEIVWVGFEIVCLYYSVTTERDAIFGKGSTLKHAILFSLSEILICFICLNFLRVGLGDVSMFKFWIFTQVLIVCVPGMYWKQRGTRTGACWQLAITLVLVAIMSFNPSNMWALISPAYFGVKANPWFYAMGIITILFSFYDVYVYATLPKKPSILENGKKPIW